MKDSYLSDEELKAFIATLPTRRLAAARRPSPVVSVRLWRSWAWM